MAIISTSLDEESITALDSITESLDLKGRSEAARFCIRSAVAELKKMEEFEGPVEGVMVMVHESHGDHWVNMIQHKYEDIIKTQLHSHLQNRMCLEVMIISGDGRMLQEMMHDVHSVGGAKYMKFVRSL